MLDKEMVKDIERALNNSAEIYYDSRNGEVKERNRGYCQGVAFMLAKIGYRIEWDNGKATVAKDD